MITKKLSFSLLLAFLCILMLSGCGCEHEWLEADCNTPKTCSLCQETEGEALGHAWQDAACTGPKHCAVCSATVGDPLPHTPGEVVSNTDYISALKVETQSCTDCGAVLSSSETTVSMVDSGYFCLSPEEFVQRLNHIYASTGITDWSATLEEMTDESGNYCMVSLYCGDVVYARVLFNAIRTSAAVPKKDERIISSLFMMIYPIEIADLKGENLDTDTLLDQAKALYMDENLFMDILSPVFQTCCTNMSEDDIKEFIKAAYWETRTYESADDWLYQSVFSDVYVEFANLIRDFAFNQPYYVTISTSDEVWVEP